MRNLQLGIAEQQERVLLQAETGSVSAGELPRRSEIADEFKWRLEDMYASNEDWEKDAQAIRSISNELAGYSGRLGESADVLLQALKLQDQLGEKLSRLVAYARMRRDEDNTNAVYQALTDQAMTLAVQVQTDTAFVEPELLSLPDDQIRRFIDTNDGLKLYRFAIEDLLRQKPHVLSAEQEQLLAQVGEIASAPQQIFRMFNNADTRFPKITDEKGREVELTHGRYIQFLESRDQGVRQRAFEAMYGTFEKHRNTLAAIHGASVKKDVFYARVRNYNSARESALESDNVPVSVYDNLISAVHEALPALHKYLKLRQQVLGLEALHMYDLYTPMVSDVDIQIPYQEAVQTVEAAIAPLGSDYVKVAAEGMQSGWIDVYENRGKTSGAYSSGTYGVHPYILLNYQDTLDNMFTLAHELGHAMHTYYSHQTQPFVYSHYTIFVAEVASTCNENLLLDHLLKTTDDRRKRASLINHHLETIRGTVFRQTMFAEFEMLTHAHVEQGGALTPEWLCETYYKLNEQFFGAVCIVDQSIEMEWARIPHFYTPFYVYKYATGMSAATALSQKILSEGQPAVDRYMNFLKNGGSDYPIELLRKAGVDMESPEPVRETLGLFSRMVDELAELLK